MRHLSRGLAAGAAGLLLSAGLALPASAAPEDCNISVEDVEVAEGDAASGTVATFTVTGTSTTNACDGLVVNYQTSDLADEATAGTDYTAENGSVAFAAGKNTVTFDIAVIGDTVKEGDEAFLVTLTSADADAAFPDGDTETTAEGLIAEDDTIGAGGTSTADRSSGPVGASVNVTATNCSETTGDAALVSERAGEFAVEDVDEDNTVTNGTFTAQLAVPADADPADRFYIRAICGDEAYADIAFDVTTFTGANGYRMVAADGGIFTFGDRAFHGSTGDLRLNKPIVGGATDISDYDGYWIVASDGGIFAFNAEFHGSLGNQTLSSPAVEIEPTPTGRGYYIVLADGKVYTFGDANFVGDMSGKPLNKAIIGMSVTPTGKGYWLVASDGGIFNFGDAGFFGSMGDQKLNAPVIDLAPSVDNSGYYLLGADGGVFTFGTADFKGSTGSLKLNAPVVAMLVAPNGAGYWLAASDGGVFTFGAVEFLGSMGGTKLNSPVLDLVN